MDDLFVVCDDFRYFIRKEKILFMEIEEENFCNYLKEYVGKFLVIMNVLFGFVFVK